MNETYNITMQTPMGMEKGTINFTQDGDSLSGSLNILRGSNDFSGGKVEGSAFVFSRAIAENSDCPFLILIIIDEAYHSTAVVFFIQQ